VKEKANHVSVPSLYNILRSIIVRFGRSLLLAVLAICMLSVGTSHARSLFWPQYGSWWGNHAFRHKHQPRATKPDLAKKTRPQDASKGPLQIIISIADQRISLYDNGALIARSSVSTGVEGHPTPLGVFSVISKQKWHRSNIYSGAPMPYMQRITWSGIALHAGDLPGYPASHGCIRLSVFAPKPKVASGSPESSTTGLAGDNIITTASTNAPPLPNAEAQEAAKVSAAASEAVTAQKVVPISVFVSRKLSRLFVRQGFTPLFDAPVKIQNSAEPMGTHVFNVMEFQNEGAAPRWTVVSIPEKSSFGQWTPSKLHKRPVKRTIETVSPTPDKAKAALDRIEIPQDVVERISGLLTPGSSLVISDYGISDETGKDTDFIVLTR